MPFNSPKFPGRLFSTVSEYQEACSEEQVESPDTLDPKEVTQVTAVVMPAPRNLLEKQISTLEKRMDRIVLAIQKGPGEEGDKNGTLEIGAVLEGESKGQDFTLEVIPGGFLCSDGVVYQSLSGAALGVSGNRRSGWKFWKDSTGTPIGQVIGRFKEGAVDNPFNS